MLDQLPTELNVYIFQTAAYMYRFSDRQSVVNLAMSCRTVYDIVCPILHHTLIVTDGNAERLASLASTEETRALAERILRHVRFFVNRCRKGDPFDPRLLVNVERVETVHTKFVISSIPAPLKSAYIFDINFLSTVLRLPPDALRTTAYVNGILPVLRDSSDWDIFFADPAAWMRSLLERIPSVTHLGLAHELPLKRAGGNMVEQYDCAAIGTVIRTALESCPRLQCFAIKTVGIFSETRRTDLEKVLCEIGDPRIKVWFDMRTVEDWGDHQALCYRDIMEGRSLWTEVRSL